MAFSKANLIITDRLTNRSMSQKAAILDRIIELTANTGGASFTKTDLVKFIKSHPGTLISKNRRHAKQMMFGNLVFLSGRGKDNGLGVMKARIFKTLRELADAGKVAVIGEKFRLEQFQKKVRFSPNPPEVINANSDGSIQKNNVDMQPLHPETETENAPVAETPNEDAGKKVNDSDTQSLDYRSSLNIQSLQRSYGKRTQPKENEQMSMQTLSSAEPESKTHVEEVEHRVKFFAVHIPED